MTRLVLSSGQLNPAFDPATTNYTVQLNSRPSDYRIDFTVDNIHGDSYITKVESIAGTTASTVRQAGVNTAGGSGYTLINFENVTENSFSHTIKVQGHLDREHGYQPMIRNYTITFSLPA